MLVEPELNDIGIDSISNSKTAYSLDDIDSRLTLHKNGINLKVG